jgi:glycosyltransferase involved in cell wall biosynthesis
MAGRTAFFKVCLASALHEANAYPPGTVEVLVSVNGPAEETIILLRRFQEQHPLLRCVGFTENKGFDCNYLNCVQEARGEFVWVMGDDDMFLPGCLAPVLAATDAGADAILCGAYECDIEMKPLQPRGWFKQPTPARVWQLDTPQDLKDYFDLLQYEAGAFAFISAGIYRRERFLEGLPTIQLGMGIQFVHVLGMMIFLASPTTLHWIPQPLFLNRLGNDFTAASDPWRRLMNDLRAWIRIADLCFPDRGPLRAAFMTVLRNNHQDVMIRALRWTSGTARHAWIEARQCLLEAGFDPILVNAVDLGYGTYMLEVAPPRNLDPEALCLADLPMVTRGARRVAVLAMVGLADFLGGTPLLEALRAGTRATAIRVVCPQDLAPLLAGFDLQVIDRETFLKDDDYMNTQLDALRAFAPDLLVNLDRQRGVAGDLLVMAAGAAGVLGYDNETPENLNDAVRLQRSGCYRRVLPKDAPGAALAEALGLQPGPGRLWPDQACLDKARAFLAATGWDPGRTLGVLADDPGALVSGARRLDQARQDGWTAIGLGGPGTQPVLGKALGRFGERARNLGGTLPLADMIALLHLCGAFTAGSSLFQALAAAAGCPVYAPEPS